MKLTLAVAAAFIATSFASSAIAGPVEDIMTKGKCNKCHTEKTTKKGKSFADIAASYKGKPDPTAGILEMFKTGGKDDHDKVPGSDADLKAVIAFVLSK